MDKPHCLIVHNSEMNIALKTSISNVMPQINKDRLIILVDDALIPPQMLQNAHLAKALQGVELSGLKKMVRLANRASVETFKESALSTPFDAAFAQALSTPHTDGLTAQGELAYHITHLRQSTPDHKVNASPIQELGYALIHLCHWRVGGGHVMMQKAQGLDAQSSKALRMKLEPLFESEGIELFDFRHDTWIARSKHFLDLPSASLNKVMNEDVLPWLIGVPEQNERNTDALKEPSIQTLRRLQSEIQMFLYDQHASAPTFGSVNSIWFSGTGTAPKAWDAIQLLSPLASQDITLLTKNNTQVLCLHGLTQALERLDFASWLEMLKEMDHLIFEPLHQTPTLQVVLCGRHQVKRWSIEKTSWIQKSLNALKHQFLGVGNSLQLLS